MNWQVFLRAAFTSWLGAVIGTGLFGLAVLLFAFGSQALSVVGLTMAFKGAIFNVNNLLFAVFYTMWVVQRGLTVKNTLTWAGIMAAFGLLFGLVGGMFSVIGLIIMVAQSFATAFGAHAAHKVISK